MRTDRLRYLPSPSRNRSRRKRICKELRTHYGLHFFDHANLPRSYYTELCWSFHMPGIVVPYLRTNALFLDSCKPSWNRIVTLSPSTAITEPGFRIPSTMTCSPIENPPCPAISPNPLALMRQGLSFVAKTFFLNSAIGIESI